MSDAVVHASVKLARNTYTYLRLGVVGVLFSLAISVLYQVIKSGCAQKSISAYYYTPARSVFVGGLLAIGLALLVMSAKSPAEEAFMRLAGLFAPVVAFAPTQAANLCSVRGGVNKPATLFENAEPAINNNMTAYFAVVIFALGFMRFLKGLELPQSVKFDPRLGQRSDLWVQGLSTTLATALWLFGLGWFLFARDSFYDHAHMASAILLFACLIVVVFASAYVQVPAHAEEAQEGKIETGQDFLGKLPGRIVRCIRETKYGKLGLAMVLAALGIYAVGRIARLDHTILIIEASLIALFAVFWGMQTFERQGGDMPLESVPRSPS